MARRGDPAAPDPTPGRWPVDGGTAELLADADSYGGWLLTIDGTAQSYVDVLDPTHLEFDYVARMASVLAALPAGPLRAVHLGGGGCTLARWLHAVRPGSRQVVVEADGALAALVRRELGLPRAPAVRLRVGDARTVLGQLGAGSADVVLLDVYADGAVPASVASREAFDDVRRVLAPTGLLVANVADGAPLGFARGQAATLAAVFAHVLAVAAPGVLAGRRWGNVVLAASAGPLPVEGLRAWVARSDLPTRVLDRAELLAWTGGATVVTDATATGGRPIPRR